MKNLYFFSISVGLLLSNVNLVAQSFEETNFPDLTTTPSASRSANFVDVNGDGWDDIFITNGVPTGSLNMLYINNTDGTFTTISADEIVLQSGRSDGASFADADNDGDLDCFEVTYGFNGSGNLNNFYRNNGDGTFSHEPAIAMGTDLTYSEMTNWIDLNNDQLLDVYVTNSRVSQANLYYENQGDGSFLKRTDLDITSETLKSRSIDWIDYDNDGDCDLFVTNEEDTKNSLFRNDGANNFTQITNLPIVLDDKTSAGSSWADIDNDGDFDLFVANWDGQNNQLFLNNGGNFVEQTSSVIASGGGSSFGSTFGDMDNDGDLDLFVCNAYFSGQQSNFVYINNGNGVFTQDMSSTLAIHSGYTFGSAFGDYDGDGWLDIVLANTLGENQTNSLYHNIGSGNNWIKLHCVGTASNTSAIGAKVRVRASINGNNIWQTRKISAVSGYCSQNSYTNHFGLGNGTLVDEIEISWPSGLTETFDNVTINQSYTAIEGMGTLSTLENTKTGDAIVYPVPARNEVYIKFPEGLRSSTVQLYDLSGKLLMSLEQMHGEKIVINRNGIESGAYLLKIISNNKITTYSLIYY